MGEEVKMGALIDGYGGAFNRTAAPVRVIHRYASVEGLIAGETLAHSEDIIIAIGMMSIASGIDAGALEITPVADAAHRRIDAAHADGAAPLTDRERAAFGGIAAGSINAVWNMLLKVKGWTLELTMCHQVKPLKRSNILNYFKGCSVVIQSTDYITQFLNIYAPAIARLAANNDIRTVAVNNTFVKYHIAYASSGQLVVRVIDDLGVYSNQVFTGAEILAARASAASQWNVALSNAVTERSIVITYGYLDVGGALPDNWYQGTKAWDAASLKMKAAIRKTFQRLSAVSRTTVALDAATTPWEVYRAMPAVMRAAGAPALPAIDPDAAGGGGG